MMRVKTGTKLNTGSAVENVFEYHERTKHTTKGYAKGPELLDWDLQPNPYRIFEDAEKIPLTLDLNEVDVYYSSLYKHNDKPDNQFPLNIESLGIMLGLALGISAHKEYMGDRWALRCNPSSGNLHPTEAYIICQRVNGLSDGIYHYLSQDHSLQQRYKPDKQSDNNTNPMLVIGLSSISWREAWKYGERALRYCQLDVGHAIAALNYAAACLGWRITLLSDWGTKDIATLCGLDRLQDFNQAELENADIILSIEHKISCEKQTKPDNLLSWITKGQWNGKANILDKYPMYSWPIIEQAEQATEINPINVPNAKSNNLPPVSLSEIQVPAKQIIYQRRSAQQFDKQTVLNRDDFFILLDKCLCRSDTLPWNVNIDAAPMLLLLYVHRVDKLAPGLYILGSSDNEINNIKKKNQKEFLWQKPNNTPTHLPFYLLSNTNVEKFSKSISCHQAIASDGAFSLSMILKFESLVTKHSMNYRKLHWQAGMLGQLLYLEAENLGLRGTGIGCFFDDAIHSNLGLTTNEYQVLYNFTIGGALNDPRILTLPAYTHLELNL